MPNGAAGFYLMGQICRQQITLRPAHSYLLRKLDQISRAAFCFKECLKINPLFWSAFEQLSDLGGPKDLAFINPLGEFADPAEYFGSPDPNSPEINQLAFQPQVPFAPTTKQTVQLPQIQATQPTPEPKVPPTAPLAKKSKSLRPSSSFVANHLLQRMQHSTFDGFESEPSESTPTFKLPSSPLFRLTVKNKGYQPSPFVSRQPFQQEEQRDPPIQAPAPAAKAPPPLTKKKAPPRKLLETPTTNVIKLGTTMFQTPNMDSPLCPTTISEPLMTETPHQDQDEKENDLFSEAMEPEKQASVDDSAATIQGTAVVLSLFRTLGSALQYLSRFQIASALEELSKLNQSQYETGWVLCRLGKAYLEVTDCKKAAQMFQVVRKKEPYRSESMEIYSTVLWLLKDEVQLSFLAQQLVALDKNSPSTWCAVGNCFSLQRDHSTAIKFFKRAIQIDPSFPYAHTLRGHEHIASDNWDKALTCFRTAIRLDRRHFNAWYGLGIIYFRQLKYSTAEYHFRRALAINSQSSILFCYIGMVLRASQRHEEALEMLEKSVLLDPGNPLAKYKKAAVLVNLGRHQDAIGVLEQLKESTPREAPLHFLLGKIYKKRGQLDQALGCFTLALDFAGPANGLAKNIKVAIAKLKIEDLDDDDIDTDKEEDDCDFGGPETKAT